MLHVHIRLPRPSPTLDKCVLHAVHRKQHQAAKLLLQHIHQAPSMGVEVRMQVSVRHSDSREYFRGKAHPPVLPT